MPCLAGRLADDPPRACRRNAARAPAIEVDRIRTLLLDADTRSLSGLVLPCYSGAGDIPGPSLPSPVADRGCARAAGALAGGAHPGSARAHRAPGCQGRELR